ncbi:ActS/PrrB/RegB family redox-sensitive histidine kinase [Hellea balneolensis]|uniref:ActS/PrrB/RegB family redox-sensitive histidine kinase n=1 Tax=Hellea balneolensis TaxID=287478 RepID=UPI000404BEFE|nr:ActS/PrrB/RegB family redox-sensitive histidine kinase [Hellea balneolensis]
MNAPDLAISPAPVKLPTDAPAMRKRAKTSGQLRRSTLVLLRWCAIAGQSLALLIVTQVLGFDLPLGPCLAMIGLSIFVNIVVTASYELERRVGDREAGLQLGFDLLQLAALLWLTGGMANPFALLFLAPVVTSATTLNKKVLLSLGLLATGLSFGLIYNSQPLPWDPAGSFTLPLTFRLGVFSAIIIGSAFTSLYAWRATKESRAMSDALAATEAVLAHEQKLAALGGMAAAAAHELGTPLATIQVIAKEMTRELEAGTPLGEDAALMLSQAQRCREILMQLSQRGDEGDAIHDALSIEDLLEEAAEPYITFGKDISLDVAGDGEEPVLKRQAELLYGLKNFIENAVDFAKSAVELTGRWDEAGFSIIIDDDGAGFDPAILGRLGQPYVSKRQRPKQVDELAGGLGLGVFIAATLIERTGGKVTFGKSPAGGARIELVWSRKNAGLLL